MPATTIKPAYRTVLYFLLVIGFVVLSIGCNSKDKPCSRFRRGNYFIRYSAFADSSAFFITRNDSVQTEIDQRTGDYSRLSIEWSRDCAYALRLLETSRTISDNEKMYRMMMPLQVEILQTTERYYVFSRYRYPDKEKERDTMWVREQ